MCSPFENAMTTPHRAPATPDANTELSARTATFAPSAHNMGQTGKRAGVNEHGSPATVPNAKVDSDATDAPDSPDPPTEPPRTPMHEEPPTEAEVTAPLNGLTGSDVSLDTALGWPTLGEANTREGTRNTHHPSAQPTLQATPNPPPPQPTTATYTNTTHNPASACTVLPATALRVQGGSGIMKQKNLQPKPNHPSSPGMRNRLLRPTNPPHANLIRSTERRASGRRVGAARHAPCCSCPQNGGIRRNCWHQYPGPARPDRNTNLLTNLLWWQDDDY